MITTYKFIYTDLLKELCVYLVNLGFHFIFVLQSYPFLKFVLKESAVIAQWAEAYEQLPKWLE